MAPEPTSAGSTGIAALLIAILGPLGGEYAAIIFAALGGALWPLQTMKDVSKKKGAFFLFRVVITAVLITGSATYWLEAKYELPALHGMTVVAFFIGAMGNGFGSVIDALRAGLAATAKALSTLGKDAGAP
jgi:hypothetical protein